MKLMHLADLHIGKRVNDFSMIEDQRYVFKQIMDLMDQQEINAVLLAGDVFDKSIPSVEAIQLFDWFITKMSEKSIPCYIIGGNHDSGERLSLASSLLEKQGLIVEGTLKDSVKSVELQDDYGTVWIHMIPYIKPIHVKNEFPDASIESYEDAMKYLVSTLTLNPNERHVLMAHQLVLNATTPLEFSDSEVLSIGGLDQISYEVFNQFDYVALGHLHKSQKVGREGIRYSGSPLKYSFSEVNHKKAVTVVTLKGKGDIEIEQIPLTPLRDLRKIRGPLEEILKHVNTSQDYVHVTLTDQEELVDALLKVRSVYPNTMILEFDKNKIEVTNKESIDVSQKTDIELFVSFFHQQNQTDLTKQQLSFVKQIMEDCRGEEHETN